MLVMLLRHLLWFPLFIDTIFTVAVTFALGIVPGLVVATFTWATDGALGLGFSFHPFLAVAIVEVFLVCALRPADPPLPQRSSFGAPGAAERDLRMAAFFGIIVKLAMIYIVCVVAASILGGVIDFLFHTVWGAERHYYIGLNAFRMILLQEGMPVLPTEIFARFKVNLLDRLVAIFGGYLVSRAIVLVVKKHERNVGGGAG